MKTIQSKSAGCAVSECFYDAQKSYVPCIVIVSGKMTETRVVPQRVYDLVCGEMYDANALPLNMNGKRLIGFPKNYAN